MPQIDFSRWGKRAVAAVETYVLGRTASSFAREHPERIRVPERYEFAKLIPPLTIISNSGDRTIEDQKAFIAWCEEADLPRLGIQRLELTTRVAGHTPLKRIDAVKYVVP